VKPPPQPTSALPPQQLAQLESRARVPSPAGGNGYDVDELGRERHRREEAEAALLGAAERVKIAEARAAEFESGARDAAQLRRKVDQLNSDLRRRGDEGSDPAERVARQAAEVERDRLRQRVAELEALVMRGPSTPSDGDETAKLRRQVEQMAADLRRLRAGAPPGGDAAKIAELSEALRRAEAERDQARGQARGGDPAAADAAIALGDSLAELRSSLRAASDEATVLTQPAQSVQVVTDALSQATEQLETARANLRALGKLLGVA
jgi:chromosome segregation ATPase